MYKGNFRLIIDKETSARENLAREESIIRSVLEEKVPNTIRFWRNEPSTIIGQYQVADIFLFFVLFFLIVCSNLF